MERFLKSYDNVLSDKDNYYFGSFLKKINNNDKFYWTSVMEYLLKDSVEQKEIVKIAKTNIQEMLPIQVYLYLKVHEKLSKTMLSSRELDIVQQITSIGSWEELKKWQEKDSQNEVWNYILNDENLAINKLYLILGFIYHSVLDNMTNLEIIEKMCEAKYSNLYFYQKHFEATKVEVSTNMLKVLCVLQKYGSINTRNNFLPEVWNRQEEINKQNFSKNELKRKRNLLNILSAYQITKGTICYQKTRKIFLDLYKYIAKLREIKNIEKFLDTTRNLNLVENWQKEFLGHNDTDNIKLAIFTFGEKHQNDLDKLLQEPKLLFQKFWKENHLVEREEKEEEFYLLESLLGLVDFNELKVNIQDIKIKKELEERLIQSDVLNRYQYLLEQNLCDLDIAQVLVLGKIKDEWSGDLGKLKFSQTLIKYIFARNKIRKMYINVNRWLSIIQKYCNTYNEWPQMSSTLMIESKTGQQIYNWLDKSGYHKDQFKYMDICDKNGFTIKSQLDKLYRQYNCKEKNYLNEIERIILDIKEYCEIYQEWPKTSNYDNKLPNGKSSFQLASWLITTGFYNNFLYQDFNLSSGENSWQLLKDLYQRYCHFDKTRKVWNWFYKVKAYCEKYQEWPKINCNNMIENTTAKSLFLWLSSTNFRKKNFKYINIKDQNGKTLQVLLEELYWQYNVLLKRKIYQEKLEQRKNLRLHKNNL